MMTLLYHPHAMLKYYYEHDVSIVGPEQSLPNYCPMVCYLVQCSGKYIHDSLTKPGQMVVF